MKKLVILFLALLPFFCFSQKRGSVWCFGDSALIDFSDTLNIGTGTCEVKSRGSCVSISDSTGALLFYAFTRATTPDNTTNVYNANNQLIQDGDSIVGEGWYHELVIITDPGSDSLYFLFSIGVTGSSQPGLWYSIVDISANGGLGAVIQKNILLQSFQQVDCLTAIKHGNGRDWWILFRRWNDSPPDPNNEFHSYLVTPSGVINNNLQNIGSTQSTGFGNFSFNGDGSKFAYSNPQGLLELYDFDRCSGIISNPLTIYSENPQAPYETYWSSCYSPSGDILYVTRIPLTASDTSRLYQFNLTAPNIAASADTLWETDFSRQMGQLKLAPDGKIYQTNNYYGVYPYPDTTYNVYNMNLSVIHSPDSLGTACNLQPYSFYLGGARTYFGLPNNPDYELSPLAGSPCDTLYVSVKDPEQEILKPELHVNYIQEWKKLFVNAQRLKGSRYKLEIMDLQGRNLCSEKGRLSTSYYIKEFNAEGFGKSLYLVRLQTDKETLIKKSIIQ